MIHRAVTLADGFSGGNVPLDEVRPLVREIRAAAEAAGRDPATLQIVSRGTLRLHDTPQGANRRPNPVDNLSVRSALGAGRNLAQPPARVYRQSCPPPRQMPASSARPTGLRRIGSPFNVVSPQCSLVLSVHKLLNSASVANIRVPYLQNPSSVHAAGTAS